MCGVIGNTWDFGSHISGSNPDISTKFFNMKILFLDCDGVINHNAWYKSQAYYENDFLDPDIDPKVIERLNKLTNSKGVKVVISSNWKVDSYCISRLKLAGLDNVIDVTPTYLFNVSIENYCRGIEIKAYVDLHPEIDKYLIIDDMNDFFDEQQRYFLHIDYQVGFTEDDLNYCLKYFE